MRVKLVVYINLDPVPGPMGSAESARNILSGLLNERFGQYNPLVSIEQRDVLALGNNTVFSSVVLSTRKEAETVVRAMKKILADHGEVYVSDLKELVGLPPVYLDSRLGWRESLEPEIKKLQEDRWTIAFRTPEEIQ